VLEASSAKAGNVGINKGPVIRVGDKATTFSPEMDLWLMRLSHKLSQKIQISKDREFDFGFTMLFLRRFGEEGFQSELFGKYYFFKNLYAKTSFRFSPKVSIVSQFGTSSGLGADFGRFHPEVLYLFDDYEEANIHKVRSSLSYDLFSYLRLGAGYEYARIDPVSAGQNFHSIFTKLTFTPSQWITVYGEYEHKQNGFEGGRTPNPFNPYNAHVAGGGFLIDLRSNLYIGFSGKTEQRDNDETLETFLLSIGYSF